jgi:hypothetical protein
VGQLDRLEVEFGFFELLGCGRHGMDDLIDSFWKQRLIIYLLRKKRDMESVTSQPFQNENPRRAP